MPKQKVDIEITRDISLNMLGNKGVEIYIESQNPHIDFCATSTTFSGAKKEMLKVIKMELETAKEQYFGFLNVYNKINNLKDK